MAPLTFGLTLLALAALNTHPYMTVHASIALHSPSHVDLVHISDDAIEVATDLSKHIHEDSGTEKFVHGAHFLVLKVRGGSGDDQRLFLPAVGERIGEVFKWLLTKLLWWRDTRKPLVVVNDLDVDRYSGTWYEIASIKRSFQRGLGDVTAQYSPTDEDGVLKVVNAGRTKNGKGEPVSITGTVRFRNPNSKEAKLVVKFKVLGGLLPISAPYWVVEVGENLFSKKYSYAVVVNGPSRSAAWVLSRTPNMSSRLYSSIISSLKDMDVPTQRITTTAQKVSDYWQLE